MKYLVKLLIFLTLVNLSAQWKQTNGPNGSSVVSIYQHNDLLFAGTASNNGIYLLNNSEDKWIQKNTGLPDDIRNINTIISKDNIVYFTSESGVFKSTNNGDEWLNISPDDKNNFYYSIDTTSEGIIVGNNEAIFFSYDEGNTWSEKQIEFTPLSLCYSDKIYAGTFNGIYTSEDDGASWTRIDYKFGNNSNNVRKIKVNANYIYAVSDEGLWVSTTLGDMWLNISPSKDINPTDIYFSGETILLSTFSNGIYISENGGQSWSEANTGLDKKSVNCIGFYNNEYYIGTLGVGLLKSTANEIEWNVYNTGLLNSITYDLINIKDTIIAATYNAGINKTTDNGDSWSEINDGLLKNQITNLCRYDNTIFATQYLSNKVYKSTNFGEKWVTLPLLSYVNRISNVIVNDKKLYATSMSYLYLFNEEINNWDIVANDTTWSNIDNYFFKHPTVLKNVYSFKNCLFVGTNHGVFLSENKGVEWQELDSLFREHEILHFSDYKDKLFVLAKNNYDKNNTILIIDKNFNVQYTELTNNIDLKKIYAVENTLFFNSSTKGVFYSHDNGITLNEINEGLKPTIMFGDTTYTMYSITNNEEYIFIGMGSSGVLKAKLNDFGVVVGVNDNNLTETRNYLYTYPPYPQPASTEVRSLVYFDTSLEMNTESVKVYNTNGVEVGREQDVSFERINAYSGNLIWNCTNVPDGVYLIQISHGDKKQTIKVMVRK